MLATARLTGQTTGAALVALLFHIDPENGCHIALLLAGGFALAGSVVSFTAIARPAAGPYPKQGKSLNPPPTLFADPPSLSLYPKERKTTPPASLVPGNKIRKCATNEHINITAFPNTRDTHHIDKNIPTDKEPTYHQEKTGILHYSGLFASDCKVRKSSCDSISGIPNPFPNRVRKEKLNLSTKRRIHTNPFIQYDRKIKGSTRNGSILHISCQIKDIYYKYPWFWLPKFGFCVISLFGIGHTNFGLPAVCFIVCK